MRHATLHVRAGEILGLAGLVGSGRTELARTLFGLTPADAGEIVVSGRPVRINSPADAIAAGIAYVPEDRRQHGVVLDMAVAANITIASLERVARRGLIDRAAERAAAERHAERLRIKTPSVLQTTGALSGGNQQKVVLAKWLAMDPKVIIFDEPTRGIDIGAKSEIYRLMRGLADRGVAVLMISSDMEEVIGVSDRIAVMHEGRISGLLERSGFSEENVLRLAVGKPLAKAG